MLCSFDFTGRDLALRSLNLLAAAYTGLFFLILGGPLVAASEGVVEVSERYDNKCPDPPAERVRQIVRALRRNSTNGTIDPTSDPYVNEFLNGSTTPGNELRLPDGRESLGG